MAEKCDKEPEDQAAEDWKSELLALSKEERKAYRADMEEALSFLKSLEPADGDESHNGSADRVEDGEPASAVNARFISASHNGARIRRNHQWIAEEMRLSEKEMQLLGNAEKLKEAKEINTLSLLGIIFAFGLTSIICLGASEKAPENADKIKDFWHIACLGALFLMGLLWNPVRRVWRVDKAIKASLGLDNKSQLIRETLKSTHLKRKPQKEEEVSRITESLDKSQ